MKSILGFLVFQLCWILPTRGQTWKIYYDSASKYQNTGHSKQAVAFYLRARKELKNDSSGISHNAVKVANALGDLHFSGKEFSKAIPYYEEAKNITQQLSGKGSTSYASSCRNLSSVFSEMGAYDKALPYLIEAKEISERLLGKEHPGYAAICTELGLLYKDIYDKENAVAYLTEGKDIYERLNGKYNAELATSSGHLGLLFAEIGEYERAESLLLLTRQIRDSLFGKQHPDYGLSCSYLGNLYYYLGQFEKARDLYLEDQKIIIATAGKKDISYARNCGNLGNVYAALNEFNSAKPYYIQCEQLLKSILGKDHPQYSFACSNLGTLYADLGDFPSAVRFLLESKRIDRQTYGPLHPSYGNTCYNLAGIYHQMGLYEKAEALYLEDRKIQEAFWGKEHPDYANSCKNLAGLYRLKGENDKANALYLDAFQSQRSGVDKIFRFTSESEKVAYLARVTKANKEYYSFAYAVKLPGYGLTYDVIVNSRTQVLSSSRQLRQAINSSGDTALVRQYSEWIKTREEISSLLTKPKNERGKEFRDAEGKARLLEKSLTRQSEFFKQNEPGMISWKNIQRSLKEGEAAVEFCEFQYYTGKNWSDSIFYIAVLTRKENPQPELIRLFEKKQLDSILVRKGSPGQYFLNALYTGKSSGNKLYDMVWRPVEKYLGGIHTVYFAAAGIMHKIAFDAIPVNDKEVLSDRYRLIQFNSTASIINWEKGSLSENAKVTLLGAILYDVDSITIRKAVADYTIVKDESRSVPADLQRNSFPDFMFLPGTAKEVDGIQKLASTGKYEVAVLDGIKATEEAFKSLSGQKAPDILHIATHGFFFPDPGNIKEEKKSGTDQAVAVFKDSEDPLIRSGLALSGANNAWRGNPVRGVEDGILTAYEVSNMYLPATKLAVLSACETGLGDIQGSEGVYGLQRAFKIAGVENLLMSLWKVPDEETAEFMQEFYQNLFSKQPIQDAFFNAQLIMKNKFRKEPYKWAAWVLIR